MIIHNIQEKYLYVPVGKNAILDPNLNTKDKGYLGVLELHITNPKYKKISVNLLKAFAEQKSQFKHLKDFGFVTEHEQAAFNKNQWGWTFYVSSFDIRQDNCSVVYHRVNGEVSKKMPTSDFIPTALPSDKAIKPPKSLFIDPFHPSQTAKGLFMVMMCLNKNKDYKQEEIREKSNLGRGTFNAAWKELKDAGYLTVIKIPNGQRGMSYNFVLNYIPEPDSSQMINLNKNLEICEKTSFFTASRDDKKSIDCKVSNNIRNILSSPFMYKRDFIISSKKGIFEDELKPILKHIKDLYTTSTNSALIDNLNNKLLNKFKNKPINLVVLIERYRNVLGKFNNGNINVIDFNAYSNAIIKNEFNLSFYNFIQNYSNIKELLSKPLVVTSKKTPSGTSIYKKYIHGNYDFNKLEFELKTKGLFDNIITEDLKTLDLEYFGLIKDGTYSYKSCPEILKILRVKNPDIENKLEILEEYRLKYFRKKEEEWLLETCLPNLSY
jgi:hypothetical protein